MNRTRSVSPAARDDQAKKRIFVLPGEIAITRQHVEISTLLGSCVSVVLYNRKHRFGGLNHFMLPTGAKESIKWKYGDYSTTHLIRAMLKLDRDVSNIDAHIYGGAVVIGHLESGIGIGPKNSKIAKSILNEYGIKIVKQQIGGDSGIKIVFDNHTGQIDVSTIQKSELAKQVEAKKQDLAGRKIRVLIVDDSAMVRHILSEAIGMDGQIKVIGEAANAYEARSKILELDPDVITLDIIMPKMDGITFLKKLMVHYPKPVIIVSSIAQKDGQMRQRANDIGAVDVFDKEELNLYKGLETVRKALTSKIKLASTTYVEKKDQDQIAHI